MMFGEYYWWALHLYDVIIRFHHISVCCNDARIVLLDEPLVGVLGVMMMLVLEGLGNCMWLRQWQWYCILLSIPFRSLMLLSIILIYSRRTVGFSATRLYQI